MSVTLNRDEYGVFILEDPDQNACTNITNSTTERLYCPPPPENCYNMWDLDRLNYTTWFYEDGSQFENVLNHEGNYWSLNEDGHYMFRLDGNYVKLIINNLL